MKTVYALEPLPKSMFLAGPTPRDDSVCSWRDDALDILADELHYDGTVFVPENRTGRWTQEYDHQIEWEWGGMDRAAVVVFWVPRLLDKLPGFTTNVEFGLIVASGKAMLGFPDAAPKTRYLAALAQRFHAPVFNDLRVMLRAAVEKSSQP